jgi:hypothetical protein
MDTLFKTVADYGLTGASIAVLAFILIKQLDIMREFRKSIEANTSATIASTEVIRQAADCMNNANRNHNHK